MNLNWSMKKLLSAAVAAGMVAASTGWTAAQSYHFSDQSTSRIGYRATTNQRPTGIVPVDDPRIRQSVRATFSDRNTVAPPSMEPVPFFPKSHEQILQVNYQQEGNAPPFAEIPGSQEAANPFADQPPAVARPSNTSTDEPPAPDMTKAPPVPKSQGERIEATTLPPTVTDAPGGTQSGAMPAMVPPVVYPPRDQLRMDGTTMGSPPAGMQVPCNCCEGMPIEVSAPLVENFATVTNGACDGESDLRLRLEFLEQQVHSMNVGRHSYCSPGGFYAGGAAVFAKPHFKEAFKFSQTNVVTGEQNLYPFEYDYEIAPRGWFGYKSSNGLGWRATYWEFDHDGATSSSVADGQNIYGAHAVTIIFPANIFAAFPGSTLTTSDSLSTEVFNLYGTYDACIAGVAISGGFGLRYAKLRQEISAAVIDPAGLPQNHLDWSREFEGVGPSVVFDAKKRIGSSPLYGFVQGGGALLYGEKTLDRFVQFDQSPNPSTPFLNLKEADEVVGIGELGFGLELGRQFSNGYSLTVRGLYEGQLWAEAGAPTLGFLGFEGFGIQVELKR